MGRGNAGGDWRRRRTGPAAAGASIRSASGGGTRSGCGAPERFLLGRHRLGEGAAVGVVGAARRLDVRDVGERVVAGHVEQRAVRQRERPAPRAGRARRGARRGGGRRGWSRVEYSLSARGPRPSWRRRPRRNSRPSGRRRRGWSARRPRPDSPSRARRAGRSGAAPGGMIGGWPSIGPFELLAEDRGVRRAGHLHRHEPLRGHQHQLVALRLVDQHLRLGRVERRADGAQVEEVDAHPAGGDLQGPLGERLREVNAGHGREIPVGHRHHRVLVLVQASAHAVELRRQLGQSLPGRERGTGTRARRWRRARAGDGVRPRCAAGW